MAATPGERTVQLGEARIFVRERGREDAHPVLFLHGWPQDGSAWDRVIERAGDAYRCLSIDLPGIGRSALPRPDGDPVRLAHLVHDLIGELGLSDITLVGHDMGGMIAFAYLTEYDDLRAAVIMDTVIPGIPPWEKVLANPWVWHFAFHSIPELPERLVGGNVRAYFDYFFDAITAVPDAIGDEARDGYARSYSSPEQLAQGFAFYRALWGFARRNQTGTRDLATPTLYLRGEKEGGELPDYEAGLSAAGVRDLTTAIVPAAGHFAPEEAPADVWAAIRHHIESVR